MCGLSRERFALGRRLHVSDVAHSPWSRPLFSLSGDLSYSQLGSPEMLVLLHHPSADGTVCKFKIIRCEYMALAGSPG